MAVAVSYSLAPVISFVRRAGELSVHLVCADVGPARPIQNAENDLDDDVACAIVRNVIVVGPLRNHVLRVDTDNI